MRPAFALALYFLVAGCWTNPSGGGLMGSLVAQSFDAEVRPVLSFACTDPEIDRVQAFYIEAVSWFTSGTFIPSEGDLLRAQALLEPLSPNCMQAVEAVGETARLQQEVDRRLRVEYGIF